MRYCLGLSEYHYRIKRLEQPIYMDTRQLINGHLMLSGMSGTGKSHLLRQLIASAGSQGIEVDVFDVHHDLAVSGAAKALYSEQSRLGYNPLELNPDPHSGGVRKRINELVYLVNQTGTRLGSRQESVLRNLLQDVYFLNGIYADNAGSWVRASITERQHRQLLEQQDYAALKRYYPCLSDAIRLATRKLKTLYLGADSQAISALEQVNKAAQTLQKLAGKSSGEDEVSQALQKAQAKAIEAYSDYVMAIQTGRELSDVLKYNSKEVIQSVLERLQQLEQSGVFSPNPPDFGQASIRLHQIKHLSDAEKRMLVYTRAEQLFRQAQDDGITSNLTRILVVDEAPKFVDDCPDNVLNKIALEARKFGLALWCAGQSPESYSEEFLTNVGTTILLPIHSAFWDKSVRKLKISPETLKACRPREVAAVKLQALGQSNPQFGNVLLPHSPET